jgi:hypothetical protein
MALAALMNFRPASDCTSSITFSVAPWRVQG